VHLRAIRRRVARSAAQVGTVLTTRPLTPPPSAPVPAQEATTS